MNNDSIISYVSLLLLLSAVAFSPTITAIDAEQELPRADSTVQDDVISEVSLQIPPGKTDEPITNAREEFRLNIEVGGNFVSTDGNTATITTPAVTQTTESSFFMRRRALRNLLSPASTKNSSVTPMTATSNVPTRQPIPLQPRANLNSWGRFYAPTQPAVPASRQRQQIGLRGFPPAQPIPGVTPYWQWRLQPYPSQLPPSQFKKDTTSNELQRLTMLRNKVTLGEVNMMSVQAQNSDFLAGYRYGASHYLRYSPPPKSEPWPMPQIFIGHDDLFDIDPSSLAFKTQQKQNSCETLSSIIDRYKNKGLLFQSARRIAIDDAIVRPGAAYLPSTDFPISPEEKNNSENSFFQRKVAGRTETPSRPTAWIRPGISVTSIKITVSKCADFPTENSKESYGIRVTSKGIMIYATEVWGVLYALETLSQLIFIDETGNFMVREATVEDWPRFPHRGLLLDSSRHFLPVSILKQNIDAMVQNKFNVFHWHLSDDQSFPLHLNSFPEFAKTAAFSPSEIYTPDDVGEVVEYARLRGVRIMPEIDSPSHVFSWRHLPTDVLTRCYSGDTPTGDVGPLDPTNEETYKVLEKIFADVGKLFPDTALHSGGDEVPKECWQSNPNITEYRRRQLLAKGGATTKPPIASSTTMTTKLPSILSAGNNDVRFAPFVGDQFSERTDLISLQELMASYNKRLLKIFKSTRPTTKSISGQEPYVVMWEEAFDNDQTLSRDVVIHVWKNGQNLVKFLVDEGFGVLFSQCWYLNYVNYGIDWTKFYQCDPTVFGPAGSQPLMKDDKGILGGEVCMWGEYIDETNLMSTLWPRASAAGERLWSSRTVTDLNKAGRRLEEHRCRMIRRGIPASPVSGPGSCDGNSGFVSASDLWQQETGGSEKGGGLMTGSDSDVEERSAKKVLFGSRAALYFHDDDSFINGIIGRRKRAYSAVASATFITIRIDYGVNHYLEISIDADTCYMLSAILLLALLIWLTLRRSGLKYFRPIVSVVRSSLGHRSKDSRRRNNFANSNNNSSFISTPSPKLWPSPRSSNTSDSATSSSYSSSTSSSVVKQQNLD